MTATTPVWGLPYPDDYNAPADSPSAFRDLALAVDPALSTRRPLLVPYTGWTRQEDVTLTADVENGIHFRDVYPQPPSSTPAATAVYVPAGGGKTQHTEFTIVKAGIHTLELDITVKHATVGTVKTIVLGTSRPDGTVMSSAEYSVHQATANVGVRFALHLTGNLSGTFYAWAKPLGASWTMLYARIAMIGV